MKILVVDDDVDIAEEVCAFLGRRGHHTVMATGAKSGAAALFRESFDVILTDMRMPDGTGLDVLRAANDACQKALRVVVTGQATEDDLTAAEQLGAQRIFTKPISLRLILAAFDVPKAA